MHKSETKLPCCARKLRPPLQTSQWRDWRVSSEWGGGAGVAMDFHFIFIIIPSEIVARRLHLQYESHCGFTEVN